ncbi:hypothetical protein JOC55_000074 [Paenibacillus sacheonensis]|nr:hypothetical protein [Paenibacillus sacheonensis]
MNESMIDGLETMGTDWLSPQGMLRICEAVRYPREAAEALIAETERLTQDAAVAEEAKEFYQALFVDCHRSSGEVNQELLAMGEKGEMLAAVVYAGAIPRLWERCQQSGIPAGVLIDTVQDIIIWMETHRKRTGRWGLSELNWLHRHMTGGLFRLGRLQFEPLTNPYAVRVFRHRTTGEILTLADAGTHFLADGQLADNAESNIDDSCEQEDSIGNGLDGSWISSYTFDGKHYEGTPLSPLGLASRGIVRLPADTWSLALQQGDEVLNVHIPEGSPLSREACSESYAKAVNLAAACFPGLTFRAFVCQSWLLAPQFRTLLPERSNIRQFQSDYRLLPLRSDEAQTLERVFGYGTTREALQDMKAETSLQHTVRDHLISGGRIQNGAGFILMQEQ